jgi:hypothetical protein
MVYRCFYGPVICFNKNYFEQLLPAGGNAANMPVCSEIQGHSV